MEAPLSVVLVCVSVCVRVARAEGTYETYKLDSFRLCGSGKESGSFYIRPWKAAILTFGNPPDSNLPPPGRDIHECKVSITTQKDFGLGAVVQDLSIKATLNKHTNGWECDGDYIQISTAGTSTISKLLGLLSVDFKSKKTQELCGKRTGKPRFSEVGSNADVFSTLAHNIDVEFHQALRKTTPVNNSFRIVITTFKHIKEVAFSDACQGQYQCRGSENYCINPEYVCDSNYNCAVPLGGGDELKCKDPELYHPVFSTTTTIITALAAIVGGGFLLGCIITLVKKMHSRRSSQSRSVTPRPGLLSDVSAPPMQRQHTLPPYEAVVMADADPSWKSSPLDPLPPGELPPNYESLFPDGPPKSQSAPPTAPSPVPSTNNQPTAPNIEDNQPEQRSSAATVSVSDS
ncbi:uncharacterized protein LOC127003979 isoform X1 [Eriocheir sinensis]|uniref:uncharacterized protein LOC127003979 isoform X1 n=1 Tax=Eriocheir sinensis TaxID=95602 RepID=UPI0021C6FEE6|nr:uncharacterized protein LOC127003979 isoform X1 [Eriocheir sinensis]